MNFDFHVFHSTSNFLFLIEKIISKGVTYVFVKQRKKKDMKGSFSFNISFLFTYLNLNFEAQGHLNLPAHNTVPIPSHEVGSVVGTPSLDPWPREGRRL